MWPARPGCCSVENDKSPDTDHFVGGHHQASSPAKISQKIHKGDKSLKIWSSQSVHKIIYHLIFWETDGGREMPGLSNANCCQSWVIAPSVGQPRSLGVTWAMADTVIIINAATQCRTFSHLQLRSKSSGQWDKKITVLTAAEQVTYGADIWCGGHFYRAFTDSSQCVITSSTHYMFSYTADKLLLDFNVSAWSQLNIWPPSQRTESLNRIHFNA